ncbi:hypothetical protein BV25DRAFT_1993796 [Artomyces pyxidatus]|uniref:Uncharacterized protein n=1 Tax=Artomyces pyxidatus TaxID=48021 RepID=A0ACB8SR39_9AGAM|nr:hypothetical protein BV25DRAFT_1993796 [Artomyces pyxidatus]
MLLEEVIDLRCVEEGVVTPDGSNHEGALTDEDNQADLQSLPRYAEFWSSLADPSSWYPDSVDATHDRLDDCAPDASWWTADMSTFVARSSNGDGEDSEWSGTVDDLFSIGGDSNAPSSGTPSSPSVSPISDVPSRCSTPGLQSLFHNHSLRVLHDYAQGPDTTPTLPSMPEPCVNQPRPSDAAVDDEGLTSQVQRPMVVDAKVRCKRGRQMAERNQRSKVHPTRRPSTRLAAAESAGRHARTRRAAAEKALVKISQLSDPEDCLANDRAVFQGLGGSEESPPGPSASSNPNPFLHTQQKGLSGGRGRKQASDYLGSSPFPEVSVPYM